MKAFSQLLDRLTYTPARNAKLMLMRNYFLATPDPDRGYALAALTNGLPISFPLRRVLTEIGASRFDPELFRMSRDDVGDTAETVALIWPVTEAGGDAPRLSEIVAALSKAGRGGHAALLTQWLDRLDATGRWALLKFLGGAPRVGVSARLAKQAVADAFGKSVDDIEELWHGVAPPYTELFAWLEQKAGRPPLAATPIFRPLMLAHPLEEADWQAMNLDDFAAEWKWDGIRIQVAAKGGATRLFSRTGDDIGQSFPELVDQFKFDAVLDGELLVVRNGEVAPFSDLQQRLNRKTVTRAMLTKYPVHVRFYDALEIGGEDLRGLPFTDRRGRLEKWRRQFGPAHSDLSEVLSFASKEELKSRWEATREEGIEGLMLKRRTSPYLAGRPKGHWYKWKRAALTADCVLLYAQKGSGKRSSFYSDYTFGAWTEKDGQAVLVPVGKAYSGFTDEELVQLDRFVRQNTIDRFGPVRSVTPKLVLEIAFDAIQPSTRHKSGIAMRFPRVSRIRWDKPANEADTLETLKGLMSAAG
ncbi:MAG: cisplatin damage response ATP-dependent DNA ligase [Aestuariivirga sp.]|uniref:cisplatin damage response ATP-dependent DNA ligase n=1 Tax=Aestuariivirga sp. TaxID=2650926 RepID=UPI0025BA11B5|nr:cisplatin damage response ATP-dependent DNA ligase [Aestuariivirga sp.]MCA3560175.1 cisplatin damage response ATP-dependent DNA ligase [Aestuariivirga sp.]